MSFGACLLANLISSGVNPSLPPYKVSLSFPHGTYSSWLNFLIYTFEYFLLARLFLCRSFCFILYAAASASSSAFTASTTSNNVLCGAPPLASLDQGDKV